MKHCTRALSILALSLAAQLAYAHDPKEHAREAVAAKAGPDCAAMQDMEPAKMDPNDPVTKAMLTKCGDASGHAGTDHSPVGQTPKPHDHGSH